MRTLFALSLVAAAFAFVPSASAECVETACVVDQSYAYGTCDDGYNANYVFVYNYDANGYTSARASTSCSDYPGYYDASGVDAYAGNCDANWNCDYAGAYWYGGDYTGGSYCWSEAWTYVDGQFTPTALPLCDVGNPPAIPALLP